MIKVNAIGDACPLPVVKAIKATKELKGQGEVEVLVDNEIAVQNLTKMAKEKGYTSKSAKIEDHKYQVVISVDGTELSEERIEDGAVCTPDLRKKNKLILISSDKMGEGNDELGKILIKGYLFAVLQQEELPETIIFYNGGAKLTCEGSESLEDLVSLDAQGVEIMTCGTCLNYYGLTEKLKIGSVSNMYSIAEKMAQADVIIKP